MANSHVEISSPKWEEIYLTFLSLYQSQTTIREIVHVLKASHGFRTTVDICRKKIKQWKEAGRLPPKNFNDSEKRFVARTYLKRKELENRRTQFKYHNSFPISDKETSRFVREFEKEEHHRSEFDLLEEDLCPSITFSNPTLPAATLESKEEINTPFTHYTSHLFYEHNEAIWKGTISGMVQEQEATPSNGPGSSALTRLSNFAMPQDRAKTLIPIAEMTNGVCFIGEKDLSDQFSALTVDSSPATEERTFTLAYLVDGALKEYKNNPSLNTSLSLMLSRLNPAIMDKIKSVYLIDADVDEAHADDTGHQIWQLRLANFEAVCSFLEEVWKSNYPPSSFTTHAHLPQRWYEDPEVLGSQDPAEAILRVVDFTSKRVITSTNRGHQWCYNNFVKELLFQFSHIKENIWEMLMSLLPLSSNLDQQSKKRQLRLVQALVHQLEIPYSFDYGGQKSRDMLLEISGAIEETLRERMLTQLPAPRMGPFHRAVMLIDCCQCGMGPYLSPLNVVCVMSPCNHQFCRNCRVHHA